jgi:hypothetical protein
MPSTTTSVPAAVPGDTADVAEALDVARAFWEGGNKPEALRFVKRAVEAADQAGKASRFIALARAFADLENAVPPAAPSGPAVSAPAAPRGRSTAPPPVPSRPPPLKRSAAPPPPTASAPPPRRPTPPPPAAAPPTPAHTPSSVRTVRPAEGQATMQIRVSVRTSVRDAGLLVVRPLPDGQAPPPGTREAFLVMPDAPDGDAATNGGDA